MCGIPDCRESLKKYNTMVAEKAEGKKQDEENMKYELWQHRWTRLKKRKIVVYLTKGYELFTDMVHRLLKCGVMHRLFSHFDFFSMQDRD